MAIGEFNASRTLDWLTMGEHLAAGEMDLHKEGFQPIDLHRSAQSVYLGSVKYWALIVFLAVFTVVIAVILFAEESMFDTTPRHADRGIDKKAKVLESDNDIAVIMAGGRKANTKANLMRIEASDCEGTWVLTYRRADVSSKVAMELLFRCNIIPVDEFATSQAPQQHIEECVWIATQMLREKSLDEWVDCWPQARREFEQSVTACFAARADVVANLFRVSTSESNSRADSLWPPDLISLEASPARSIRGFMDASGSPSISPSVPGRVPPPVIPIQRLKSDPSTCRSTVNALTEEHVSWGAPQARTYGCSNASTAQTLVEEPPSRGKHSPEIPARFAQDDDLQEFLNEEQGRGSVLARCREIIQETPSRSKWQSLPSTQYKVTFDTSADHAGDEARRPRLGDLVMILKTDATVKWFPEGIGHEFRIRTDDVESLAAPYQVEGHHVWLQECDVHLVEEAVTSDEQDLTLPPNPNMYSAEAAHTRWGSSPAVMQGQLPGFRADGSALTVPPTAELQMPGTAPLDTVQVGNALPATADQALAEQSAGYVESMKAQRLTLTRSPVPASSMDPFTTPYPGSDKAAAMLLPRHGDAIATRSAPSLSQSYGVAVRFTPRSAAMLPEPRSASP